MTPITRHLCLVRDLSVLTVTCRSCATQDRPVTTSVPQRPPHLIDSMKTPMRATALVLAALALPPSAARAEEANPWRFTVTHYMYRPGIFSDIGIGRVNGPGDVSFDKIWHNLEFTAMGSVAVGYGRWALTTDLNYLAAGATGGLAGPGIRANDRPANLQFEDTTMRRPEVRSRSK